MEIVVVAASIALVQTRVNSKRGSTSSNEEQNVQRFLSIWENFHQVVTPWRVLLWHLGMKRRGGR